MINKKIIFIFLLILFFCISGVSAVDLNETNQNSQIATQINETSDVYSSGEAYFENQDFSCEFKQTGNYYGETKLHVSVVNASDETGIENTRVGIYVNENLWKTSLTDVYGDVDMDFKKLPGSYSLKAKLLDYNNLTIGTMNVKIAGISTNFELAQNSAYYKDSKLTLKLTNIITGNAMSGEKISLKFSNGKTATVTTNSKGIATYNIGFRPGTYSVTASTVSKYINKNTVTLKNFPIGKTYLKISAGKISTTYNSGKNLNIKLTNYFTKHTLANVKLSLKIFTGKKYKTATVTTNSKGIAKYDISKLSIGSHKITIKNSADKNMDNWETTTTVKISKAKLTISAPSLTTQANNTKTYKITVKNKETKKAMGSVKVTVKVYTGSKFKTYNLKTNSKGQVSFTTQ